MTDAQKLVRTVLDDMCDDLIKVFPDWRKLNSPLTVESTTNHIGGFDAPKMKLTIQIEFQEPDPEPSDSSIE